MKKKQIEKIPYLGLEKTSRKKNVRYIGVTAIKNVAHERHFFLEIYKNKKAFMHEPVVRIVCTKKDFGTFFPDKGEWSRQKLYNGSLIWEDREDRSRIWQEMPEHNILKDAADLERIKKFFKDIKVWDENRWWEYIQKKQENIVCEERWKISKRKYEKRQQALKEREENTPELPEKMLLDLANERFFNRKHYLFYKKRGGFAKTACSKCGGVTETRWKEGISYESQFQKHIQEPREGDTGYCPLCGANGEFKCQGKVKSSFSKSIYVFLGQKYKKKGMVMRYIEITKEWQLQMICENHGPEMYNACEKLSGIEIARGYFEEGKELQKDFHKHNPYTGNDFWDDCNLYGLSTIRVNEGSVLPETYTQMQGTIFQYCGLNEYMAAVRKANPIDYMERYMKTPQIEMLVKLGLIAVVQELVKCRYGIIANAHAGRLDGFLGIKKDKVKFLMRKKGDLNILKVLQTERRLKQQWTEEQVEKLAEIRAYNYNIGQLLQIMTIQKLLNRIEKYAGCEFGDGCQTASARLRHIAGIYFDYLSMRRTLGYDLENTVYQQPRNLETAHNNMVTESNKIKMDKRLKEVAEKFPDIRKKYRTLRKKYFYQDDDFVIRPARSAEEIVMEGKTLHHCVGGNDYLEKHSEGISTILMLRFKDRKTEPYITVEIEEENIIQWYGANDKKPDKDNMQRWLDQYIDRLKCGRLEDTERNQKEDRLQMLA